MRATIREGRCFCKGCSDEAVQSMEPLVNGAVPRGGGIPQSKAPPVTLCGISEEMCPLQTKWNHSHGDTDPGAGIIGRL